MSELKSPISAPPATRQRMKDLGNSALILLVSGLSVYYTAAFWLDTGGNLLVLAALVAVWELGKFLRSDDVAELLARYTPRLAKVLDAMLVVMLAFIFVAGSAAYTVGGVLVNAGKESSQIAETARNTSTRIPSLQSELVTLDEDISQAQSEVAMYTKKGWVANARASRTNLEKYRARKAEVATELDRLQGVDAARVVAETGASPRFVAIASASAAAGYAMPSMAGLSPAATLERVWSLVIGALLEVMSISLLIQRHLRLALERLAQPAPLPHPATKTLSPTPLEVEGEETEEEAISEAKFPPLDDPRSDHGGERYTPPPISPASPHPQNPGFDPVFSEGEGPLPPLKLIPPPPSSPTPNRGKIGAPQGTSWMRWGAEDEDRLKRVVEGLHDGSLTGAGEKKIRSFLGCGSTAAERIRLRLVELGLAEKRGAEVRVLPLHQWPTEYRLIQIHRRNE